MEQIILVKNEHGFYELSDESSVQSVPMELFHELFVYDGIDGEYLLNWIDHDKRKTLSSNFCVFQKMAFPWLMRIKFRLRQLFSKGHIRKLSGDTMIIFRTVEERQDRWFMTAQDLFRSAIVQWIAVKKQNPSAMVVTFDGEKILVAAKLD